MGKSKSPAPAPVPQATFTQVTPPPTVPIERPAVNAEAKDRAASNKSAELLAPQEDTKTGMGTGASMLS